MQYIWVTHRRRTSKANSARFHIRSTSRQVPHSRFLAHQRPSLTLNKPMHPISIRLLPQFRKVCINQKRQRASLRSAFAREHGCCIIILFLRFKPVFRATAMLHLQSGHKKVLQRQKSDVRASRDVSPIDCISYYSLLYLRLFGHRGRVTTTAVGQDSGIHSGSCPSLLLFELPLKPQQFISIAFLRHKFYQARYDDWFNN